MKPDNIAVGQIWTWSGDRYEVLGVYENAAVLKRLASGKEYWHEWPNWDSETLVVPKKKVYLSVWKNQANYECIMSEFNHAKFLHLKYLYLDKYKYTFVKEWELEYEPIEAS